MARVIAVLESEARKLDVPVVTLIARTGRDPYRVLVSCLLSLRTKDETTSGAASRLFRVAVSPRQMLRVPVSRLRKIIYPVGFYRTKARALRAVSRVILERFGGAVPANLDGLLTLPGVGRKTANLVLTRGHRKPGICVDIHVHRISNRLGFVKTRKPEETEFALRERLPKKYWIRYNHILVAYGQGVCRPVSPWCSRCRVRRRCARAGVVSSR